MNIFVTSPSPIQSAREHCSVHRTKMILESAQMLSTAHHILDAAITDGDKDAQYTDLKTSIFDAIYKPTHINHPCSIFTRSSKQNYSFVWCMAKELCAMYKEQTNKRHKTEDVLNILVKHPKNIQDSESTDVLENFKCAMPSEYIITKNNKVDVCLSYQNYLNAKFMEWLTRDRAIRVEFEKEPSWLDENVKDLIRKQS